MIKKLSIAVLLIISAIIITSCGGSISESEAEEIIRPLIEASHELNVIYFGEGLPKATDEELLSDESPEAASRIQATNYSYAAVSSSSKYQTEAELKSATEKVFSKGYSAEIYSLTFDGFASEFDDESGLESLTVYARYIENYGVLTVSKTIESIYSGREYDFSTLKVEKSGSDYMLIKIDTTSSEGEIVSAKLRFVKESDGWRLDSPTY